MIVYEIKIFKNIFLYFLLIRWDVIMKCWSVEVVIDKANENSNIWFYIHDIHDKLQNAVIMFYNDL